MYNRERVIIDIRKFDIEEIAYRYSLGKILFCEYSWPTRKYQEKTEETIKALIKGIPFPVVYASELQTGELLILNKNGRLQMLLEELRHGNIEEQMDIDSYSLNNILYSPITMYVIDYTNQNICICKLEILLKNGVQLTSRQYGMCCTKKTVLGN